MTVRYNNKNTNTNYSVPTHFYMELIIIQKQKKNLPHVFDEFTLIFRETTQNVADNLPVDTDWGAYIEYRLKIKSCLKSKKYRISSKNIYIRFVKKNWNNFFISDFFFHACVHHKILYFFYILSLLCLFYA